MFIVRLDWCTDNLGRLGEMQSGLKILLDLIQSKMLSGEIFLVFITYSVLRDFLRLKCL